MKEKGITLVALVITIIILLILAGITISTLGGENGLISRTKLAQEEYDKAQAKEELQLKISELQLKIANEEVREATLDDFYNLITEDTELTFVSADYKNTSTEDAEEYEKIRVLYKNYIFTVDSSLGIVSIEENSDIANVDFSYEVKEKTEEEGKTIYQILIKLQSNEKIAKVEYGDQILKSDTGTDELAIDFEVEKGAEYTFRITTVNGKSVEKILSIETVQMSNIILEKTELLAYISETIKLNYSIEPDFAEMTDLIWTSSNEEVVTVDDSGVIQTIAKGEATVTVKAKDGDAQATCYVTVTEKQKLNIEELVDAANDGDTIYLPEGIYELEQINSYHEYATLQCGINDKGKQLTFVGKNEKTRLIYYGDKSTINAGNPFMCLNKNTIIRNMIIEFYPGKSSYTYNALFSHTYGNLYNVFFIIKDTDLQTCYGYNNRNYLNVNVNNCAFYFEDTSLVCQSYWRICFINMGNEI